MKAEKKPGLKDTKDRESGSLRREQEQQHDGTLTVRPGLRRDTSEAVTNPQGEIDAGVDRAQVNSEGRDTIPLGGSGIPNVNSEGRDTIRLGGSGIPSVNSEGMDTIRLDGDPKASNAGTDALETDLYRMANVYQNFRQPKQSFDDLQKIIMAYAGRSSEIVNNFMNKLLGNLGWFRKGEPTPPYTFDGLKFSPREGWVKPAELILEKYEEEVLDERFKASLEQALRHVKFLHDVVEEEPGTPAYCRITSESRTSSRVMRRPEYLTEEELQNLIEATVREMGRVHDQMQNATGNDLKNLKLKRNELKEKFEDYTTAKIPDQGALRRMRGEITQVIRAIQQELNVSQKEAKALFYAGQAYMQFRSAFGDGRGKYAVVSTAYTFDGKIYIPSELRKRLEHSNRGFGGFLQGLKSFFE